MKKKFLCDFWMCGLRTKAYAITGYPNNSFDWPDTSGFASLCIEVDVEHFGDLLAQIDGDGYGFKVSVV